MVAALVVLVLVLLVVVVLVLVAEAVETEKLFFSAWSEILGKKMWPKYFRRNVTSSSFKYFFCLFKFLFLFFFGEKNLFDFSGGYFSPSATQSFSCLDIESVYYRIACSTA